MRNEGTLIIRGVFGGARSGEENVVVESEPNDIRQDAINIVSGSVVRGAMYPTGDIDVYRLNLMQPSVIDFEMPDGAFDLAIYDGDEVVWRSLSRQAQTIRTEMLSGQGKAADKLSAHIKCLEEMKAGNGEFRLAAQQTRQALDKMDLPELKYFCDNFLGSMALTLDEME